MDAKEKKMVKEQLRSLGAQALEGTRKLLRAGSVRGLRVRDSNGKVLVQLPFTATVVGAFIAPSWASAALLAAVATGHTVDVDRLDVEASRPSGRPPVPEPEPEVHAPH